MSARSRETLVLTLPADPGLAGLTRMVSAHFFRQHGVAASDSRRGARRVEARCRTLLRAAARASRGGDASLVLVLRPRPASLEVIGRPAGGAATCLVRLVRPRPA